MPASSSGRTLFGTEAMSLDITQMTVFDHFQYPNSLEFWNKIETDISASITLDFDGRTGVCQLNDSGTLDGECYISSQEVFKLNYGVPQQCVAGMYGTADTNNAYSWCFGIIDAWSADTILAGGQALRANWEGALFFKPAGSDAIYVASSENSATQHRIDRIQVTEANPRPGSTQSMHLQIDFDPKADDFFEIVYRVSPRGQFGKQIARHYDNGKPIKHYIRFDPGEGLAVGAGAKNGAGGSAMVVRLEYLGGCHYCFREPR